MVNSSNQQLLPSRATHAAIETVRTSVHVDGSACESFSGHILGCPYEVIKVTFASSCRLLSSVVPFIAEHEEW
jgi:hypothetical protein